jgi:pilus assembly protein TadC
MLTILLFIIPTIAFIIYYRIENKKINKKLEEVDKEIIKK